MATMLRRIPRQALLSKLRTRSSRSQAKAAIAFAAASALAVVSRQERDREEHDATAALQQHDAAEAYKIRDKAATNLLSQNLSTSLFPLSTCLCLAPRRTTLSIRNLDESSTKAALESRYDIDWKEKPLGEGAFSAVFPAKNKSTGEAVAVKKISKLYTDNDAFQREMKALLHIQESGGHPNICALHEHFDVGKDYCLILDLIGGGEMFDHLVDNGAYSEADAARLVREVAGALAFIHGIGVVHADLKPENLMLSTARREDSVVKVVDFGCAQVTEEPEEGDEAADDESASGSDQRALTPAYCPPEAFNKNYLAEPPMDMWSLGVILYIMLTGCHPFDLDAKTTDKVIEENITNKKQYTPPIRNSPITAHLSESAISLIEQLIQRDPKKRLTAQKMLEHPWVRGETATTDIIKGSDERIKKFRVYKSRLQAKFFEDVVAWSDSADDTMRKTSLIERYFRSFDKKEQGFLTDEDLGRNLEGTPDNIKEEGGPAISMSDFHTMLSENMTNKYFPKGHVIYREGEIGNAMYFINSGTIEVTTKDGTKATRKQGDFFGEGALLHPKKIRSATIRCKTPVHAMEISREYFEKYLASSETGLFLTLKEKDKIRKRNRAKAILKLQSEVNVNNFKSGDYLFKTGEEGDSMYILESGKVDVLVQDRTVFSVTPGNVSGEHSILTGKPRNVSALCVAADGCVAHKMMGRDFRKLCDFSPNMYDSMIELCQRREFKKAVVYRLKKEFPYHNPKEGFDAADTKRRGFLDVDDVASLMREMDPSYTDDDISEIMKSLNLTNSGTVSFDEFKKVFIADIRTSASI